MAKRWQNNLVIAATAALTLGGPALADAHQDRDAVQPGIEIEAGGYPSINPTLLDDGIASDPAAQKRIIKTAARPGAITEAGLDSIGLKRDAADALAYLRNHGELPGAQPGQSPGDWWRQAEPKIEAAVKDIRLGNGVALGIGVLGLLGMGVALARGNITGLEGGDQYPGDKPPGDKPKAAPAPRGLKL